MLFISLLLRTVKFVITRGSSAVPVQAVTKLPNHLRKVEISFTRFVAIAIKSKEAQLTVPVVIPARPGSESELYLALFVESVLSSCHFKLNVPSS